MHFHSVQTLKVKGTYHCDPINFLTGITAGNVVDVVDYSNIICLRQLASAPGGDSHTNRGGDARRTS